MLDEVPVQWPKDLPQLKNLDDRLRCPICYEHMKNPVISTGCTHSCNFYNYISYYLLTLICVFLFLVCSLCIRNYIAIKNSCPICFGDITDGMLRSFRCMEEIIKCFIAIKAYLLNKLTIGVPPATTPVERVNCVSQDSEPSPSTSASPVIGSQSKTQRGATRKSPRETSKQPASSSQASFVPNKQNHEVFQAQNINVSQRQTQKKAPATPAPSVLASSNEVQCPVCQASMKESVINIHLDSCLSKKQEKRKPMPKLIYNLMKDAELKKRLRELGLSATGDKTTLINRHKKYTILYNSECDSANPRPVIELKAQLEREEAESRRLAQAEPRLTSPRVKKSDPDTIERENQQYVQNNKDSFEQLIKDVKLRQQQLKAAAKEKARSQQKPEQQPELTLPPTSVQSNNESNEECASDQAPTEEPGARCGEDDEITVLPTPVKVYETVSLVDSDEEGPSTSRNLTSIKRRVFSESDKSSNQTSENSDSTFPDPMASSSSNKSTPTSTDNSNGAWSPSISYSPLDETVTNDFHDADSTDLTNVRRRISETPKAREPRASPSYSPLDNSSPDMFKRESSSSGCSTPANPSDTRRRPNKRNKSQMDSSSEKRKSSRRRV